MPPTPRPLSILLLSITLLVGCRTTAVDEVSGAIQHVVICWLHPPGHQDSIDRILEVSQQFSEIPGVVDVRGGSVLPSDRQIVDSSFDLALIITLRDAEALHGYLEHPLHRRAVDQTIGPLSRKLLVYDFVDRHAPR